MFKMPNIELVSIKENGVYGITATRLLIDGSVKADFEYQEIPENIKPLILKAVRVAYYEGSQDQARKVRQALGVS